MNAADNQVSARLASSDSVATTSSFAFDNTYARLPEHFYVRLNPTSVSAPELVVLNRDLARSLALDPEALASGDGVAVLAGNRIAEGSEPLVIAYAGHQFGHFVPQLGDGRANLLGEVLGRDGHRYDVQLKGSGRTPFSRGGDGRAALGPVLREYLVSEAMAALGVPTTRALAVVTTGDRVVRESALPGAILTRIAASHLRIGTFQYFAARGDVEAVRRLAEYAIARHYSECGAAAKPYRMFLHGVVARQAHLIAHWMLLGFIHGVMNTDNTSISGETIDYGPCAFMEAYDPDMVFSSIDHRGRYAYRNQPDAAHWNLARLAETLLPLLVVEEGSEEGALAAAHEALATFQVQFESARRLGLQRKLGLMTQQDGDARLAEDLLEHMAANHADFTLTFRRLCHATHPSEGLAQVRALFDQPQTFDAWAEIWQRRLSLEPVSRQERLATMLQANPASVPRNHYVQAALDAAIDQQDFQPFEDLLAAVTHPYEERPEFARFGVPALPEQCIRETFCGT